jgi:hypothetical protein
VQCSHNMGLTLAHIIHYADNFSSFSFIMETTSAHLPLLLHIDNFSSALEATLAPHSLHIYTHTYASCSLNQISSCHLILFQCIMKSQFLIKLTKHISNHHFQYYTSKHIFNLKSHIKTRNHHQSISCNALPFTKRSKWIYFFF